VAAVNTFLTQKQDILKARMARTSIDALRAMASMQARPIPFLTTVGAETTVIGQVRYELPRTGDLSTRYDPVMVARNYVEAGVDAVSMFTDAVPAYDGTVDMTLVNEALRPLKIPVIHQNYALHEYDVVAARAAGASVVVLTSGIVSADRLRLLTSAVHRNRMTAVVHVFDQEHLRATLEWSPQVIGLSAANPLDTTVDMDHIARLREAVPPGQRVMIPHPLHTLDEIRTAVSLGVDAVTVSAMLLLGGTSEELREALVAR
jgi:indole-3-glycerol phosphate synthase